MQEHQNSLQVLCLRSADRPAFSYLVLGGLIGWADQNPDGQVLTKEVVDFSNDALQSTLVGRQQNPQLLSPENDVILQDNVTYESLDFASINTNVELSMNDISLKSKDIQHFLVVT